MNSFSFVALKLRFSVWRAIGSDPDVLIAIVSISWFKVPAAVSALVLHLRRRDHWVFVVTLQRRKLVIYDRFACGSAETLRAVFIADRNAFWKRKEIKFPGIKWNPALYISC